jgi:sporulation protein YlmC with PRC-barrel domain
MRKNAFLVVTGLATVLAASPVLAQNNTNSQNYGNGMGASTASGTSTNANANQTVQQTRGEWRTSKLNGLDVYNTQNQKLGTIDDILVNQNGQIASVVLSVGGFLGIGDRLVSVPFNQLQFVYRDNNGNYVNASGQPVAMANNNNTNNTANNNLNPANNNLNTANNNANRANNTNMAATTAPGGPSTVGSTNSNMSANANNLGSPTVAGNARAPGEGIGAAVNDAGLNAANRGSAMTNTTANMTNGNAGNNPNRLVGVPDRAILNANKDQLQGMPQFRYAS